MIRVLEKIENISLFLWLLLIQTQLGKHFWPEWSHVIGIRSDYLGPVLYLTDLIWGIWIVSMLLGGHIGPPLQKTKNIFNFENFLVIIFVLLNILVAGNKGVAIYRWGRIFQWIITIKYLKLDLVTLKKYISWIIPCWIAVESLLGLSQIVSGGSLQGIWYWLGERRFTLNTIGVAQISVFGESLIRAYGTFSHPNSMAGFLLVTILLWNLIKKDRNLEYWIVIWLGLVGVIISGSRTVWGLLFVVVLVGIKSRNIRKLWGTILVVLGVFAMIIGIVGINYRTADFVGGWDNDSLSKRINLSMVATKMWRENFMLGIGAGNFVAKIPEYQSESKFYWMQPVHNIFLLIGTELGMLGTVLVVKFIIFNFHFISRRKNWLIMGVILITGMVDHYWITLPQNWNLLAVVLAIM